MWNATLPIWKTYTIFIFFWESFHDVYIQSDFLGWVEAHTGTILFYIGLLIY